jgi:hypothetical protein
MSAAANQPIAPSKKPGGKDDSASQKNQKEGHRTQSLDRKLDGG